MSDCIFCAIANGEAPATIRHDNDQFVAFDDLHPKAATHVLIIPRAHHDNLDAFVETGGSSEALLRFATATARELGVEGRYRLITNVGPDAGQIVPHVHLHLLAGRDLPGF